MPNDQQPDGQPPRRRGRPRRPGTGAANGHTHQRPEHDAPPPPPIRQQSTLRREATARAREVADSAGGQPVPPDDHRTPAEIVAAAGAVDPPAEPGPGAGGTGLLFSDERRNARGQRGVRSDARLAVRMLSLGVVSEEQTETLLRSAFRLAAQAARSDDTRDYAAAMKVILAASRLEIEAIKAAALSEQSDHPDEQLPIERILAECYDAIAVHRPPPPANGHVNGHVNGAGRAPENNGPQ